VLNEFVLLGADHGKSVFAFDFPFLHRRCHIFSPSP
jgi:hypothetical protein